MQLIKLLIYISVLVPVFIYTLSYGIYEFKEKNMPAFAGVLIVCLFLIVIPVMMTIFN